MDGNGWMAGWMDFVSEEIAGKQTASDLQDQFYFISIFYISFSLSVFLKSRNCLKAFDLI